MIELKALRQDTEDRKALIETIREAIVAAVQRGAQRLQVFLFYARVSPTGALDAWMPATAPIEVVAQQSDPAVVVGRIVDLLETRVLGAGFYGRVRIATRLDDGAEVGTFERDVMTPRAGGGAPPGPGGYTPYGAPVGLPGQPYMLPGQPHQFPGQPPLGQVPGAWDPTQPDGYDPFAGLPPNGPTEPGAAESFLLRYAERRHDNDRELQRWLVGQVIGQANGRAAAAEAFARESNDRAERSEVFALALGRTFAEALCRIKPGGTQAQGWLGIAEKAIDVADRRINGPGGGLGKLLERRDPPQVAGATAPVDVPQAEAGYTESDEAAEDAARAGQGDGGQGGEGQDGFDPGIGADAAPQEDDPLEAARKAGLQVGDGGLSEHARKLLGDGKGKGKR